MSQVIQTKTRIKPNMDVLRMSLEQVRARYEGVVLATYTDYYGNAHTPNTGLALHIPRRKGCTPPESLPRGIGLVLDAEGYLGFAGDDYGVKPFYEQVKRELIQEYQLQAVQIALRKKRMRVSSRVEGKRLIIVGVRHDG